MTNTGELFLRCNNLTLDQYKLIALSRGLTGAVGFAVSLVVLVVILLAARSKAWDTLPKRLLLVAILYTAAFSVILATSVHYSRPPAHESAWCEAMGFILQYSESLVIVSCLVLVTALALQVVMPVYPALQTQVERTCRSKKLWEVILFLGCFLFPVLITWEPFIAPFASYGNYGPLCWFRLEINENCTYKNKVSLNEYFLWTLPFAIMSFLLWALASIITIMLCCMYCKFHKTRMGGRIKKAIGHALFLTVASFVCVAWIFVETFEPNRNFSSWTVNVTITPINEAGIVILVALYIYFPAQYLHNCFKKSMSKRNRLQSRVTERPTVPVSQWDHRNVPSFTVTHICHETVTGSDTSQLITEQQDYQTFNQQQGYQTFNHSKATKPSINWTLDEVQ